MGKLFKNLLVAIWIISCCAFTLNLTALSPVYAAPSSGTTSNPNTLGGCRYLVGLTSWDCGINPTPKNQDEITSNIIVIASNVLADLLVIAAYAVLIFVIYGGYLFIFSSGDPGKVARGSKALINASIGLTIVLLSNIILNTIRVTLLGNNGTFSNCITQNCVDPDTLIPNVIQWTLNVAGVVAAVFVVLGGITLTMSSGDPNKVAKARNAIIYACIGLAVIALAKIGTAFVTNLIKDAKANAASSYLNGNQIIISKEYNEKTTS